MTNCSLAQVRKRAVSRNCSWTTARPVFFDHREVATLEGDLFTDVDKLVGQLAEAFVTINPLTDRSQLIGGDAFTKVLAAEPSLEDEVWPPADGLAPLLGLKELFAEVTATDPVDGTHFLEDLLTALLELREVGVHVRLCIDTIHIHQKKRERNLSEFQKPESPRLFCPAPVAKEFSSTSSPRVAVS